MILNINFTFILEISFTSHPGKLCNVQDDQYIIGSPVPADNSGYYDNCKRWCVARSDCGGFVIVAGNCFFSNENCRRHGLSGISNVLTFLKNFN